MTRPLFRRVALFLGVCGPGLALLVILADADPIPRARPAVVHELDPSTIPSIDVGEGPGSPSVGTSHGTVLTDEAPVVLDDGHGGEVSRPFRAWVLRGGVVSPERAGTVLRARVVDLRFARRPRTLEEYEALRREPPAPDAIVTARRGRLHRSGEVWSFARLEEDVVVRGRDPAGREGLLETESLLCRLVERQIETDDPVTVTRPGFRLKGRGMLADATLRRVEVREDVELTLDLADADLPWGDGKNEKDEGESELERVPFEIRCSGPLIVEDPAEKGETRRVRITARNDVDGTRGERSRLRCRALELLVRLVPGEDGERAELLQMDIEEITPLDLVSAAGDRVRVEGEILAWRRRTDRSWVATVTGHPVVVLHPPGAADDDVGLEIRSDRPVVLLVERGKGLAQAVFRENVVVRRGEEELRADEVSVIRRPRERTLAAHGHVRIDGQGLKARADHLRRTEQEKGARLTVLSGSPRLDFRGRAGTGFLGSAPERKDANEPASDRDEDNEVHATGPIRLDEGPRGARASASGGVVWIRRRGQREVGRLRANVVDLRMSASKRPDILAVDAEGAVDGTGAIEPRGRLDVKAGRLLYRRAGELLILEEDRPTLDLVETSHTTTVRGERIAWSRSTGDFEVRGPVDATLPGRIDILGRRRAKRERPGEVPRDEPVRLLCDEMTGSLVVRDRSATAPPALRAVQAAGAVRIEGPDSKGAGDLLVLIAGPSEYTARLEGSPARLERTLSSGATDVFEGPVVQATTPEGGEIRRLLAPKGGRAIIHLYPRENTRSPTRIDLTSDGVVLLGSKTLHAPGSVTMEHSTWDARRAAWQPPLKLSGQGVSGTFASRPEGGRHIESLEVGREVQVDTPEGAHLTCARARVEPEREVIVLTGRPDVRFVDSRKRVWRASSALYCYRAELKAGTRLRLANLR